MTCVLSIDIFCSVVDNFGDIGVCWRLSHQLATEYNLSVRLFVDDLTALRAIVPEIDDNKLSVLHWDRELEYLTAADVVIEAFACNLPDNVTEAMVNKNSIWIDLEYLTAEDWAAGCHAIPSPHPSIKLKKTLFFPGFDARTGGIIREKDLISRRNAFTNDINAQNLWRKSHNLPEIDKNMTDISMFCYKTAPLESLLSELEALNKPIRVFLPKQGSTGTITQRGTLTIYEIPFFSQYEYDYFLWTCHINFVRGEDSFVRAQLAGKPFVWNIYVQDENAHLTKLHAFLDKIRPFYDTDSWERLANLHDLWNEEGRNKNEVKQGLWCKSLESFAGISQGAQKWADYLADQTDLAERLLAFANNQATENKGLIR